MRPMNLLSVNQLSKAYGARVLFKNISFGINYGEKKALVAKNGSGKTTLFKILRGIEIADSGEVAFRKNLSVAFLDQNYHFEAGKTIADLLHSADNKFVRCIKEYDAALLASQEQPTDQNSKRYDNALQRFKHKKSYLCTWIRFTEWYLFGNNHKQR